MIQEEISKRNESFERYRERLTNFSSEFEIGLFLYLTRQIWIWLLAIVIVCLSIGFLYIRYTPPIYESSALIQRTKQDNARKILNVKNPLQEEETLTSDIELLRSPLLMRHVVSSLPLQIRYFLEGKILNHEKYNGSIFRLHNFILLNSSIVNVPIYTKLIDRDNLQLVYTIEGQKYAFNSKLGEVFECEHFRGHIQVSDLERFHRQQSAGDLYFIVTKEDELTNEFIEMLTVSIANSNANTIRLTFEHPNQVLTRDVLQSLIKTFDEFDSIKRTESSNRIVKFINAQKDSVAKKLKESELMLKNFKDTNHIRQVKGMTESYINRIEEIESKLTKLDIDEEILREISKIITDQPQNIDIYNVLPVLLGSEFESNLYTLISVLHKKMLQYEDLTTERTANHDQIKKMRSQIDIQIKLITEGIKSLLSKTITSKQGLQKKLNDVESNFYNLPEKELQYSRLDRIFSINDKYYTLLLEKQTEYALTRVGVTSNTSILRSPKIPDYKKSPSSKFVLILAVLSSIVISFLISIVRYLSHNEITSLNEISKISNAAVSVLGLVPIYKNKIPVSQLIIDENPKSMIAESFRSIRTNLEFISKDTETKLIAITSTVSGEGKTFVTINLGGIIAFSDKKVIILDLDMRKPKIHLGFGIENDRGMSTLLIGKDTVSNCIKKSQLTGLDFITAGPIPPNPSELIINGEFDKIIAELKQSYDIIIVDNPPVGLVTDGISIIRQADIPIYIFRANYSKKNYVQNLDRLMNENKIYKLSAILNGVDTNRNRYGYNYGYGYGQQYGNYYDESQSKKTSWRKKIFKKK